jgi:TolB protein
MDDDGANSKRIVDNPEYDSDPSWSPDGRKLLFVTGRNGNFDVYEMNADGTGQMNLTTDSNRPDMAGLVTRRQ